MTKRKPPEPDFRTCGQCKHWRKVDGAQDDIGECYFNPPQFKPDEEGGGYELIRPILESNEHACGQFTGCH